MRLRPLQRFFFFWRNRTADRQLKTAQKQLENAQLSLQEERYKKGVELLGHESQVIRIGGLYALHQLAEDFPKTWALPVMELMCIFVRTPPRDEEKAEEIPDKDKAEETGKKQFRRDVEEAVQLLGRRGLARREEEKRKQKKPRAQEEVMVKSPGRGQLDFRGAYLAGDNWVGVDLGGASFEKATLEGAAFPEATLTAANFEEATITGVNFYQAMLGEAKFYRCHAHGGIFR